MTLRSKCKISRKKIRDLLKFLKFINSFKKNNHKVALQFLSDDGLDYISESIYNVLYNPDCTSSLPKAKLRNLIRTLSPQSNLYKKVSKKNLSTKTRRKNLIQSGSGISLLLSTVVPFLTSLLLSK